LGPGGGGRDNGDLWDKENRELRLCIEVQKFFDERERVEQKIMFLLDAFGHLFMLGTDYYVKDKRDLASVRAHIWRGGLATLRTWPPSTMI
jgi:hypothetical protein